MAGAIATQARTSCANCGSGYIYRESTGPFRCASCHIPRVSVMEQRDGLPCPACGEVDGHLGTCPRSSMNDLGHPFHRQRSSIPVYSTGPDGRPEKIWEPPKAVRFRDAFLYSFVANAIAILRGKVKRHGLAKRFLIGFAISGASQMAVYAIRKHANG